MKIVPNESRGFTLIEVLIAVVILSIGLLGLAGLQTLALRQNNSSQGRSHAVELINDLADRMRANKVGVDAGNYPDVNLIPPAVLAPPAFDCMTVFAGTSSGTSCNAAEMATYDLFAWQTAVAQALPLGQSQLQCTDNADPGFTDPDLNQINNTDTDGVACTVGSSFLITITWDDNGANGQQTTFAVAFQP